MKFYTTNFFILIISLFLADNLVAQPGCPAINAGPDVVMPCNTTCTNLTSTYFQTGASSSYAVSPIAYTPFSYNGGIPIIIGIDDRWSGVIPLPFNFCFFGTAYNQVVVGSNGILSFNTGYAGGFCPWTLGAASAIPNPFLPLNSIMGPYHDIDPSCQGLIDWRITGTFPCRTFNISYYQIPYFGDPNSAASVACGVGTGICGGSLFATHQIILYETTNVIEVYIQSKPVCNGWNGGRAIEGIQNATGTVAFPVPGRNNTVWTTTNDGYRFTPNGPSNVAVSWYNGATQISATNTVNVCPVVPTVYTAQAVYTPCAGGTLVTVTDNVLVSPSPLSQNINQSATTCINHPFNLPWGGTASTAGTYSHIYTGSNGCDSTVNITLAVNPVYTTNQSASTCPSQPFNLPWGGSTNTAGTYSHMYTTANGCDSTVNITLTINPNVITNLNASTCSNVPFNLPWGGTASTAGTYSHTFTDPVGCDSTVNITLAVNPVMTTNLNASTCSNHPYNLPWGGSSSTAGTYSHIYTNASGCDSTMNITLVVNPINTTNQNATTCANIPFNLPWGGATSVSGTYSHIYTNASGCDSTVNITLAVNPVITTNQNASTCSNQPFNLPWGGTTIFTGTYSHIYTNASGCDSTVNITLTVLPTFLTNNSTFICSNQPYNFPWGGSTNTAGFYSHIYTSTIGCDSTVNVNLVINPVVTFNLNANTCSNQPFNLPWGGTASTAGTYSHVYNNASASGCDSTVNITLAINPIMTTNLNASACSNIAFNLPWGGSASSAGTYSHIYSNVLGCDSTVNITLAINPIMTTNLNASTCSNIAFNLPWGGSASTAGTYSHIYSNVLGCDSTVNITLAINPIMTTNLNSSTCSNIAFNLPWGGSASSAGTYSHIYSNVLGCDSTVNITLAINPIMTTNLNASTCSNVAFNLPWGGSASSGGTYSHIYSNVLGCDSTVNITLAINPIMTTNLNASTCSNVAFNLPWGGSASTAGTYSHIYSNVLGCDSTVNITLAINPIMTTNLNASTCSNVPFNLPWGGSASSGGTYSHIYSNVLGCDSTVNITLAINPIMTTNLNSSTCSNVPFNLPWGGSASSAGTYSHIYSNVLGCDSTVNITLAINPIMTTNLNSSTCSNLPFNLPWGGSASTAGTYSHIYSNVLGCDSTVNITLAINPIMTTNLNASTCSNIAFNLPWGGSASTGGTYSHIYSNVLGCDSTVNITLAINPIMTTNLNASTCSNQPFNLPWGGSASTAGTYSHIYSNVLGCDSTMNITLAINPIMTTNLNASTCSNIAFNLPWGGSASSAGTYSHIYSNVLGCDSTVNITLAINPIMTTNLNASTCSNVPFNLPWGGSASTAGTYSHIYSNVLGCDSTVNITLAINPIQTTNLNASTCSNITFNLPWGGTASTGGTYSHIYSNVLGCDSTVNITLAINPIQTTNLNASTCSNVAFNLPWGGTASTGGTYSHIYSNVLGCDSTVNITLAINPIMTTNLNASTCSNIAFNLPWGGSASSAGTYSHIYSNVLGCDSTVNITLAINPIMTTNLNASTCSNIAFNLPWGGSASTSGTYSHIYSNVLGCDSTVNITLAINPIMTTNLNASTCSNIAFNLPWGGTASTGGTYSHIYSNVLGCDSTVNITLVINPIMTTNLNASTCSNVPFNLPWGGSASSGGTYSHIYSNVLGCDSTVNIILAINPIMTTNLNASTCSNIAFNLHWGGSASSAGTYSHIYSNVLGCDSTVNITLAINPIMTTNLNASTCSNIAFNLPWGGSASTAGTYSHIYSNVLGCDSTVNITLSINPVMTTNLNASTCVSHPFNLPWGGIASTAGTYSHTYSNASGCDSTVNITLSIGPDIITNQNVSLCTGQSLSLPWGGSVSTAGIYSHTYLVPGGCDSTVNITLSVNPIMTANQNASTCSNQPFNLSWGGTVSTAGTYSHIYTSSAGCDSTVNVTLVINPIMTTNLNASTCSDQPFNLPWGGSTSTSGTYFHVYSNAFGCDSTVNITLVVHPVNTTNQNANTCSNHPFNLPWGGSVSTAGTYSHIYSNAFGCDSTVNITLAVNPVMTTNQNANTCSNQPFNLPWGGATSIAGAYSHVYANASGCDSTVNITLAINPVTTTNLNASTCVTQPFNLPWGGTTSTAGTYSHVYSSVSGCDSTVNITLSIGASIITNQNASTCSNQAFNLPWGGTVSVAGTYSHTYLNPGSCDSTVNITLSINPVVALNQNASTCSNQPFNLPWGGNVSTAGTYSHTFTNASGCDSTLNILLSINPVTTTNQNASTCATQPFNLPWGGIASTVGTYSHTYSNALGCDSIVNITLSINPIITTNINTNTCANHPFNLPWGGTASVAGIYSHTYVNPGACDSTVNITLSINPITTTNLNASTCVTQPFNLPWGGTTNIAGTYSHIYTGASGCDSTVNITLSIGPSIIINQNASTCANQPFNLPWGGTASIAGTYSHTYLNPGSCDSTVNITLAINPIITTNQNATTCATQPFNLPWGGTTSTAGIYSHTYVNALGCDSTLNITLAISPTIIINQNASTCSNHPFNLPWGGTASSAGTYSHNYINASGCDSTVNITLAINPVVITNQNASTCVTQPFNLPWGGTTNTAGTYSHTYTGTSGCDSTVNIILSIGPTIITNLNASTCSNVAFNLPWGGSANTAGTYSHTYLNPGSCDSTVNITLAINPITTTNLNASTCAAQPFNLPWGGTASVAGTYSHTYTNGSGCDSTVDITLSIAATIIVNQNASTCSNQPFNLPWGGSASTAGIYSHTYLNPAGCDSTVNITLSINPIVATNQNASTCSNHPFNLPWGGVASVAGTYTHIYANVLGCDSTVNITLSVNNVLASVANPQICQGQNYILPDGSSVNVTGTYSTTLTGSNGCDSVITTNLSVTSTLTSTANPQICQGQQYILPDGSSVSATGTYSTTLASTGGCDSVITTNLIVNTPITSIANPQICPGQNYILPDGSSVSIAGTYTTTLASSSGCDSVITTNLTVHIIPVVAVNPHICHGQNYILPNGILVNASGTYTITLAGPSGCDSVITTNLTIGPPLTVAAIGTSSICAGDAATISAIGAGGNGGPYSYSWNNGALLGSSLTVAPTHDSTFTVIISDGCSSPLATDSVQLTVHPTPVINFLPHLIRGCTPVEASFADNSIASPGSSYYWDFGDNTLSNDHNPSHVYTVPGQYNVSLVIVTPEGCLDNLTVPDAVIVDAIPDANFLQSTDVITTANAQVAFTDYSIGAMNWEWDFGDGSVFSSEQNPIHNYSDTGSYLIRLAVQSIGGCVDTAHGRLRVLEGFEIYIPNAFTPNGDGKNDGFIAQGIGFKEYDMRIINRWGTEIFHSTSINQSWDGTYYRNGDLCQNDVYEYVILVTDNSDIVHKFIGHVTLVR